jgi:hypothetical protein
MPGHTRPQSLVREGTRLRWKCPANGTGHLPFLISLIQNLSGGSRLIGVRHTGRPPAGR